MVLFVFPLLALCNIAQLLSELERPGEEGGEYEVGLQENWAGIVSRVEKGKVSRLAMREGWRERLEYAKQKGKVSRVARRVGEGT